MANPVSLAYTYETTKGLPWKTKDIGTVDADDGTILPLTETGRVLIQIEPRLIVIKFLDEKSYAGRCAAFVFKNISGDFPGPFELAADSTPVPAGHLSTQGNEFRVAVDDLILPALATLKFVPAGSSRPDDPPKTAGILGDIVSLTYRSPATAGIASPTPIPVGEIKIDNQASLQLETMGVRIDFQADCITITFDGTENSAKCTGEYFFLNSTKKFPGTFGLGGKETTLPEAQLLTYENLLYINLAGLKISKPTILHFYLTTLPQSLKTTQLDLGKFKLTPDTVGLIEMLDNSINIALAGKAYCEVTNLVSFSWTGINTTSYDSARFTTRLGTLCIEQTDWGPKTYKFETPYSGPLEITILWDRNIDEIFCRFNNFVVATP